MHDILIDKLNLWQQIGTPKAALEIVPFLWHENSTLASHAALNLAVLLSRKPEIKHALRVYPLTQKQADWFDGNLEPFFEDSMTISSSLQIIVGRMLYLISQELSTLQQKMQKQQAELLHSRQMVTVAKMASSLAHEIMQPLQIILMKADNCSWEVEHDQIEKTGVLKDLNKIIDTSQRIDHIVKRLRILSQEHKLKLEWVDINTVIENVGIGFSEQLKSRHIHLEKNLTHDLPLIKADQIQLEQVLTILISNARDALEGCDNKRIAISTQRHNNQVLFQLTDNGVGIASDKLADIFEAFMTTKEKTGMGLGLYIAKDIIQAYEGKITVDSDINKGTTIFVTFPIAKEE
jgi:two-component system NtrC family sensor kinase